MKLKNVVMAIIEYPVYLLAGVLFNCIYDLIMQPIYMSILRAKGVKILKYVNPAMSYSELKERFALDEETAQ